jgi:transcriptional regulator with XRE-family HTH domain
MKQKKSLRQLAKELGVSPSYLSQVKHGKRPASQRVLSSPDIRMLSSVKQNRVDTPIATSYNNLCAEVAQSVEQRTENPRVPSSILGLGT